MRYMRPSPPPRKQIFNEFPAGDGWRGGPSVVGPAGARMYM